MPPASPQTTIRAILEAAELLRVASRDTNARDFAYRRSTAGLATLLDAWCVDHTAWTCPELLSDVTPAERSSDLAVLEKLRARLFNQDEQPKGAVIEFGK